ncbi:MAG TPA: right-handed parallel beta-helix repeat-containing protein [Acidimicrobiales bacterium]|nr:right-handed parallel beta-helix repeat-containing protein [Acidimicrobiales bacterium]
MVGRRTVGVALAGALVVLASTVVATVAEAAVLSCGQVITQSTKLDNDVGPCPNNGAHGIVIGANNVTLDLNGHTVFGTAASGEGAGVYMLRRSGVTVKNGTVRDFDGGVAIDGGSGNTVRNVLTRDNIGILNVTRYGEGIAILSSTDNKILYNQVIHNGPFGGIGVYTVANQEHQRTTSGVSTRNLIHGNQVVDNNTARSLQINDSDGIRIERMSTFNVISNNRVTGSGLDGIALFAFSPNNTIKFNQVYNNGFLNPFTRRGDGIRVFGGSHNTLVQGNQVRGNAANGIILHQQFMDRPPVVDSRVIDNWSVDNNRLPPLGPGPLGGPTFDLNDGNPDCDNNVWLRNRYRTANPACTTVGGIQV